MRLTMEMDSPIRAAPNDVLGGVRRRIIDDDLLPIRIALRDDAGDALPNELRLVERRGQNTHQWRARVHVVGPRFCRISPRLVSIAHCDSTRAIHVGNTPDAAQNHHRQSSTRREMSRWE